MRAGFARVLERTQALVPVEQRGGGVLRPPERGAVEHDARVLAQKPLDIPATAGIHGSAAQGDERWRPACAREDAKAQNQDLGANGRALGSIAPQA